MRHLANTRPIHFYQVPLLISLFHQLTYTKTIMNPSSNHPLQDNVDMQDPPSSPASTVTDGYLEPGALDLDDETVQARTDYGWAPRSSSFHDKTRDYDLEALMKLELPYLPKANTFTTEDLIPSLVIITELERLKHRVAYQVIPGPPSHPENEKDIPVSSTVDASMPSFLDFPNEIRREIYSHLPNHDLLRLSETCKQLHPEAILALVRMKTVPIAVQQGYIPLSSATYLDTKRNTRLDEDYVPTDKAAPAPFFTRFDNKDVPVLQWSRFSTKRTNATMRMPTLRYVINTGHLTKDIAKVPPGKQHLNESALRSLPPAVLAQIKTLHLPVQFITNTRFCGHWLEFWHAPLPCGEIHTKGMVLSLAIDHDTSCLALERIECHRAIDDFSCARGAGVLDEDAEGVVFYEAENCKSTPWLDDGKVVHWPWSEAAADDDSYYPARKQWRKLKKVVGWFEKIIPVVNAICEREKWAEIGPAGEAERLIWMLRLIGSLQVSVQAESFVSASDGGGVFGRIWWWDRRVD